MGLDMNAYARSRTATKTDGSEDEQLQYWRKFNALHGFFCDIWIARGLGTNPSDFNCVELELTAADIDALEKKLADERLTPRAGFFFGPADIRESDRADTFAFILKARLALKEGKQVFYNCWW